MQPGVVGHLDHAQAELARAEGSDHQVQEHSQQHIRPNAAWVEMVTHRTLAINPLGHASYTVGAWT